MFESVQLIFSKATEDSDTEPLCYYYLLSHFINRVKNSLICREIKQNLAMTFSFGGTAQPATATAGAFGAAPASTQPSFGFGSAGAPTATPTFG